MFNEKVSLVVSGGRGGSTENDQHQKMITMVKSENDHHMNFFFIKKGN